jgi:hypothetical protein
VLRNWVVTLAYAVAPDVATMDRWEDQLGDGATVSRAPGRGINLTIHADDIPPDHALADTAGASAAEVIDDVDHVGAEITTEHEQLLRAEALACPS